MRRPAGRGCRVALTRPLVVWLVVALLALAWPAPGPAQAAAPAGATRDPRPATSAAPGSELTVSLITIGQGDAVWEKFGHNALRVRDAATGADVAYNWGMFDFDQPNFLGRFLTGETRYWMEGFDAPLMIDYYARLDRPVYEQVLALRPEARARLRAFLEWNAREENKFYRYDYYRDNCSTRVRDAIDSAAGGALRAATASLATTTTYRSHTRRLTSGDPAVYTGIELALGHPADRALSAWEEAFLPMRLREHVRRVRVPDDAGRLVPLVGAERELYHARRPPEASAAPSFTDRYLLAGLATAAAVVLLARGAARRRAAAAALAALGGAWLLVAGLLGTALLLAGTVTRHVYMGRNENLLVASPLLFLLAVPFAVTVLSRGRRWTRFTAALAGVVAALTAAALVIKVVPLFDQRNAEILAVAVPVNLALWWAVRRIGAPRPATRAAA